MKTIPAIALLTASFLIAAVVLVSAPAFARSAAQDAERAARQEEKAAREAAKEARVEAKASAPVTGEDDDAQVPMVATIQGRVINVTPRPGIDLPVFWMPREGATATVILMSGGRGGYGHLVNGQPSSNNFLVRTREYFAGEGFNVAIVGRPSDHEDLDYGYRASAEHVGDLRKVVEAVKRESPLPVWMIGTSRGTVSTTAATVAFGNEQLAGIVLTSSVLNQKKPGAVPSQDIGKIRIPVLVLHHSHDDCKQCRPNEAVNIIRGLDHAPIKKLIMANGGGNPSGDPCAGLHYHGFIGMEKEAVTTITQWIKNPAN